MEYKSYSEYVRHHRKEVLEVWEHKLMPVLISENVNKSIISQISTIIFNHDADKLDDPDVNVPYNFHYLYPKEFPKDCRVYRQAWNKHQKMNPHHWQYWVLMEDSENPKMVALEMDFIYVIEMLCDWQAASTHYGNTAHWWYETQKENMILHKKTEELIEHYLNYLD